MSPMSDDGKNRKQYIYKTIVNERHLCLIE